MNKLAFLFWAHAFFWIVLFLYLYGLTRKVERLRTDIDALKNSSEKS